MSKKIRLAIPSIQLLVEPTKPVSTKRFISEIYYNRKLEQKLASIEPNSSVDFSYWNLIDQDVIILSKEILVRKPCSKLNLCGNRITDQSVLTLCLRLSNNSTLRALDLSHNQIHDGGVFILCEMLTINPYSSLKILSLNRNAISNESIQYLIKMLRINQTLTELSLSDNEIGDYGVKQLAHTLTFHNQTLKVLIISYNIFITDLCIDYLIRLLELNKTLRSLSIHDCNLSEFGKDELRNEAEKKSNFELII